MSISIGRAVLVAVASLLGGEAMIGSDAAPDTNMPAVHARPIPADDGEPSSPKPTDDRPTLAFAPRADDAVGGRALLEQLEGASLDELEDAVSSAIRAGNVPAFLRRLTPVDLPATPSAPMRVWVTTDYLSVGSDDDFVRVPLRAKAAERLAGDLEAILPTKAIVDAIVAEAEVRLPPRSGAPQPTIMWRAQTLMHDAAIDGLAQRFGAEPGKLVAGHMKDVVISPTLALHPDKLAIYGMHGLDGDAVQPLSVIHIDSYVDYSHGIRLVAREAEVDGTTVDLVDTLADDGHCKTISPEGPIDLPAYR